MTTQEMDAPHTKYASANVSELNNMKTWQKFIDQLNHRLIEINAEPDLNKTKPVIINKKEEIGKLLKQFEINRQTWIALKYNDKIFVVWKDLVFLYLQNSMDSLV